MHQVRTIPRTTVAAAFKSLGVDVEWDLVIQIKIEPTDVTITFAPNGDVKKWRMVDECPSCHTHAGHPHTDYCKSPAAQMESLVGDIVDLAEAATWDDVEPRRCRYPNADHGDGRGCQHEDCPKCGNPNEDGPDPVALADDQEQDLVDAIAAEPEPWVDNGCRCPNPEHHRPGCIAATTAPLEGDFGHHLREDCPDRGCCILHAIT